MAGLLAVSTRETLRVYILALSDSWVCALGMSLAQLARYCNSTSVAAQTGPSLHAWPKCQGPANMLE